MSALAVPLRVSLDAVPAITPDEGGGGSEGGGAEPPPVAGSIRSSLTFLLPTVVCMLVVSDADARERDRVGRRRRTRS